MAERRAVEEGKQQLGEEQLAVVELVNQAPAFFICYLSVCMFGCLIMYSAYLFL